MRGMSDQFEGGSMLARADGSEVGMISWGVAKAKSRILGIARTSTTSNLPRVRGALSFLRKATLRQVPVKTRSIPEERDFAARAPALRTKLLPNRQSRWT